MTTIIIAHPYASSYNYAVLNEIINKFKNEKTEYEVIDLYEDQFNPVLSREELAVYNKGLVSDPLVLKYQAILKQTKRIIYIFPIWWNDAPAILRGFFDRVMLKDFAWAEGESEIVPLLNIKESLVITTSGTSTSSYINDKNNPIENTFIKVTMPQFGMYNGIWLNCDTLLENQQPERDLFMKKVIEHL